MDLNHLRTFRFVASHGALASAARALGVPTSTVSRHLTRLESALGTDLLHRGPRGVTLTAAGIELYERSRQPLDELAEVAITSPAGPPRGTLRVSVPSNLVNLPWFADLLLQFRRAYPEVRLDVALSARPIDLEEGFDVGFRPEQLVPDSPDLIRRSLPAIPVGLYASRRYLTDRGVPEAVDELAQHDFVAPRHLLEVPLALSRGDQTVRLLPQPAMVGDDLSFVLPIVAAGGGYAAIPRPYVAARPETFVEILPNWTLPSFRPALVWPRHRFMASRVRVFIDFVVAGFVARLGRDP